MNKCPACNARYKNSRICYRCKTDLGPLLDIEQQALVHKQQAVSAYMSNDFTAMFFNAKRSLSLFYTPDSARLLAVAAVLEKRFDLAFFLWNKLRACAKTTTKNYSV